MNDQSLAFSRSWAKIQVRFPAQALHAKRTKSEATSMTERTMNNSDSDAQDEFQRQLRALLDGTKIPQGLGSTATTALNKQEERIKSNVQELLEISKTLKGATYGNTEDFERKLNKSSYLSTSDLMEAFNADESAEETVGAMIDAVIADSALRGSMNVIDSTDEESTANVPSSSTGSGILSIEREGYQDVEALARANLEAALGQGLGQGRAGLICPSCQRPVARTELDDYGKCSLCRQSELVERDVHLSLRYKMRERLDLTSAQRENESQQQEQTSVSTTNNKTAPLNIKSVYSPVVKDSSSAEKSPSVDSKPWSRKLSPIDTMPPQEVYSPESIFEGDYEVESLVYRLKELERNHADVVSRLDNFIMAYETLEELLWGMRKEIDELKRQTKA